MQTSSLTVNGAWRWSAGIVGGSSTDWSENASSGCQAAWRNLAETDGETGRWEVRRNGMQKEVDGLRVTICS